MFPDAFEWLLRLGVRFTAGSLTTMRPDMRKTPSYLKGLVETRARSAGALLRYQRLASEIAVRLAEAQAEVEACDRLIRRFDARLDPERIEPIRVFRANYGARGAFIVALKAYLREQYPSEVSTSELTLALQTHFGLDFATPYEYRRWVRGSIANRLKELVAKGEVERLHDPARPTGLAGHWRWRMLPGTALDDVRAAAGAAGLTVEVRASEED